MADLDFSRSVPDVPASSGPNTPAPYHRTVSPQVTPFPDMQSAISNYAEATNWMSNVGSFVASKASNAVAQKLGAELGKNPKGDIGIPLTDFDKTMQQSYEAQAHATLGLQASKLISDSNLEMAKANRITPELIDKTNKSISIGLQNIFKNAPASIQPSLQFQYGNMQIGQLSEASHRMIREQREDQRNQGTLANDTNAQNAYSFGINGNEKAGQSVIETTRKINEANAAARLITPDEAKTNIDTVRKSYRSGQIAHDYEVARAAGKGEQYLKDVADGKVIKHDDPDYQPVTQNLSQYVGHQQSLRNQDEQLRVAQFATDVARNPLEAGSQLQDLKRNVSPEAFEKAQLHYINALKTYYKENGDLNNAMSSWNDPASFARLTEKSINKGYDMLVGRYMQQQEQNGNPISREDAEVQVAAAAGGHVPVFVNGLRNKINSGNPAQMDYAARQIDQLYSMNAGHALQGLTDNDKALYSQFKALRDALPPEEAAKIATQNANQDPDTQKMNKEKWSSFIKSQTAGGVWGATAPQDWALKQAGLNKKDFMNPGLANEYGNMILNKYAAFYQMMNGDQANALALVKQEVNDAYGWTGVNGDKFKTLHPIEKVLGYGENSDVVPIIQDDVMSKLSQHFGPMKEAFDKKESNVYWDVVPSDHKNRNRVFGHNYPPVQVKRYTRTASGTKTDTYDVALIGNSFNWDIVLNTGSGMRPLIQVAPYLGVHTYTPNKNEIDAAYRKHYGAK